MTTFSHSHSNFSARKGHAFTLVELMVAMAVFSMVILGTVGAHIYGLKMFQFVRPRLGASDDARKALSTLMDEIRAADTVQVGNGSLTNFIARALGTLQEGPALLIQNTNNGTWIRYYYESKSNQLTYHYDGSTNQLMRTVDGLTATTVMTAPVTSTDVFTIRDYTDTTLSQPATPFPVVGIDFEFSTSSGSYTLQSRISRR